MYTFEEAITAFIDLVQAQVLSSAVNIQTNDFFETDVFPSLIMQGPELTENQERRAMTKYVETDEGALTYQEWNHPWFYHFDFAFILTTETAQSLFTYQQSIMQFFRQNRVLDINGTDSVHLHELEPMGHSGRPNLSNYRQMSGRYRLEDVLVWDGLDPVQGKLVADRIFEMYIHPDETTPVDIINIPNPNP